MQYENNSVVQRYRLVRGVGSAIAYWWGTMPGTI